MQRIPLDWMPGDQRRRSQPPEPEPRGWTAPTSDSAMDNLETGIARLLAALWDEPDERGRYPWRDAAQPGQPDLVWMGRELDDAAARHEVQVKFSNLFSTAKPEALAAEFIGTSPRAATLLVWRAAVRQGRDLGTCEWCGGLFAHGSRPGPLFCRQDHALAAAAHRRQTSGGR
ncbi:hypothetical protein J5Y09_18780 [Roseomonas sp. PWR1]|uniref:Uncharacterized protein n=1 Tax=Roseomonas nitratireducens TaxID=2820810 RepID=A0ABS4AX93_9PROT|nr:hypothetical protein [Neoroseomonas nitratireducens]MBP0465979.1 hypothetical protein [Neoroseomonas nitratireducens]